MADERKVPWWRGARGEWYVVVQVALFALILFAPRTFRSLPAWPASLVVASRVLGILLMVGGGGLMLAALFNLGRNVTPLPYPKEGGDIVDRGAYRLVRHPIYSGVLAMAFGWGLAVHGWLTLVYAGLLFVFLDVKSRREERWLAAKFPGYTEYARRVRKLVPFVY
jgi:protein-S-isoprenylcysteine O-methyltransferase Ste14